VPVPESIHSGVLECTGSGKLFLFQGKKVRNEFFLDVYEEDVYV